MELGSTEERSQLGTISYTAGADILEQLSRSMNRLNIDKQTTSCNPHFDIT